MLAVVQGATEFLPVSSSGHITLIGHFVKVETDLALTALLHLGTLFAVLLFALKPIAKAFRKPRLILLVILSTVPAALVGVLFEEQVEMAFQAPEYLPMFFCITAVLLTIASKTNGKRTMDQMTAFDALLIGIFQAVAIFPGVSRSGATIAAALIVGFDRKDSLEYSFLLAIPVIAGAGLLKARSFGLEGSYLFLISFIVGMLSLFVLRKAVIENKLKVFSLYCLTVAVVSYFVR